MGRPLVRLDDWRHAEGLGLDGPIRTGRQAREMFRNFCMCRPPHVGAGSIAHFGGFVTPGDRPSFPAAVREPFLAPATDQRASRRRQRQGGRPDLPMPSALEDGRKTLRRRSQATETPWPRPQRQGCGGGRPGSSSAIAGERRQELDAARSDGGEAASAAFPT